MIARPTFLPAFFLLALSTSQIRAADPAAPSDGGIASVLQPFVDRHVLAGAVALVASKDKILDIETSGFSDIAAGKPMQRDSVFWIASQSKPMTATALMMLVDEGKMNVDDPVEKYLPEFRGQWLAVWQDNETQLLKHPAHPITVRNILSHTGGLPFSSRIEQPTLDLLPLQERVLSYALSPLQYPPDTKYQYSNAGINAAGRIIEVVSGMPYEEFMDKRLFQPLGMKDTTFWPNKEQIARLAKSYKPNAEKTGLDETTVTQLHYPLDDRVRQAMPAGGLFSTASDTGRFCQMILNGGELDGRRYLSEAAVKQMTSKQTPDSLKDGYGFGWSTDGRTFGHGGAFSTNMTIDPQHGLLLIYMVQHAGFPGDGGAAQGAFSNAAHQRFDAK